MILMYLKESKDMELTYTRNKYDQDIDTKVFHIMYVIERLLADQQFSMTIILSYDFQENSMQLHCYDVKLSI